MIIQAHSGERAQWGISEWFTPGEYRQAEQLFEDADAVRLKGVRLAVLLEEWNSREGRAWYRWLTSKAAERLKVVLALYRTLPHLTHQLPPAWAYDASAYKKFFTEVRDELGGRVEWLELTDPLGAPAWPDASPESVGFLATLPFISVPRVCLGGLVLDAYWLSIAQRQGLLETIHACAFRQFTRTDWSSELGKVAEILHGTAIRERWLTPEHVSHRSTNHPGAPLEEYEALLNSPVERVYLNLSSVRLKNLRPQGRGLRTADNKPALIGRLLQRGGSAGVRKIAALAHHSASKVDLGHELIIGGAGFIGCNLAARLAASGHQVLVFDNLSRPGTESNLEWLCRHFPDQIRVLLADVRDPDAVQYAVPHAHRIFHFAAQVAVTTSLEHPYFDHEVNTVGTLNVLEAARRQRHPPNIVFTSTNKVYGSLEDVELQPTASGYAPIDAATLARGIDECRALKFASPYGCSKGAADQYVLDYARTFELPALVLRMSCIYGPRQFGNEDQGWVAHFIRQTVTGEPITFYGDGLQIRDVLYIDDLVEAVLAAARHLPTLSGEAFNIGGGPANALSLRGLVMRLAALHPQAPVVHRQAWRPGDQRYYVSNTDKFQRATGWHPTVEVDEGVRRLYEWMRQELAAFVPAPQPEPGQLAL